MQNSYIYLFLMSYVILTVANMFVILENKT